MKVSLLKKDKIISVVLPPQIHGNYWVTDKSKDGKERNFINIVEDGNSWKLLSNYEVSIYENNEYKKFTTLKVGTFYLLKVNGEEDTLLYCSKVYEDVTVQLSLRKDADIIIGSKEDANIYYSNPFVAKEHAKLSYKNGKFTISEISKDSYVYVNNERKNVCNLKNGDVIFIMGLKIIIIKNNIIINNIDKIKVDGNLFYESKYPKQNVKDYNEIDEEVSLYKASDYFFKAPRFRNNPDKISINVDPAPQKQKEDDTPFIYNRTYAYYGYDFYGYCFYCNK